jgi:hypothetical protein
MGYFYVDERCVLRPLPSSKQEGRKTMFPYETSVGQFFYFVTIVVLLLALACNTSVLVPVSKNWMTTDSSNSNQNFYFLEKKHLESESASHFYLTV